MASIVVTEGPLTGTTIPLSDHAVVIGRAAGGDVVLQDGQVSSRHASLQPRAGQWVLTDLGSSNGTSVNGQPVQAVTLHDGDVLAIGISRLTFREDKPVSGPAGPAANKDVELVQQMRAKTDAIRREVATVIIGQGEVLDEMLMCLIAGGHGLLIGLPGMAKTLMVRTIARVLDLKFKRIQFTPDLMPTDITGTEVLETNRETGDKEFRFIRGPIFCNLLLADEINRTPPKTQAALLEAMQEKRVTAGNVTYQLDEPFFVLATQNPIEQEGTYPLPEAQLDRFMFNIWVDYPRLEEEEKIIGSTTAGAQPDPQCILTQDEVLQLQRVVREIPVSEHVIKYVIRLVRATRPVYEDSPQITKTYVSTGAGPRAGQYLVLAAKARAVMEGRIHVSCGDIRKAAIPVLRHRILTNFAADSEGMTSMDIVRKLLEAIQEPGEKEYGA